MIIRKLDRGNYEEIDEYVGMVKKSVDRMDTITQDVVNYTELEEKLEYKHWVDMQQLTNDLIKEFQDKNKNVSIRTTDLPSLQINPHLAKNLLSNLIQNGITYCENPQPIISISCDEKDNYFQFKIEDNGVGISKENIDLAFVMFKRLHNNLDIKGSGIGLAACKKIVEGYHGEIWLESELGVGTTVFFTLPKL